MTRVAILLAILTSFSVGCSSDPGLVGSSSEVNGKATFADGKPVRDVRLNFFPSTAAQNPVSVELKADGKFSTKMIPGKYTFAFEATKNAAAYKAIPPAYQTNSAEHAVEVQAGQEIDVQVK